MKQEAITKDNISARINAVIYYKVKDARSAVIEVENYSLKPFPSLQGVALPQIYQ